jgi:hypothetical protein
METNRSFGLNRHVRAAALAIVAALALGVVFVLPPESGFYPACPIHALTGTLCPGCGGTRALHALLHGRVRAAFDFNPLVTVAIAPAFAFAIVQYLSLWRRGTLRDVQLPKAAHVAAAIVVVAFWIGRNVLSF